MDLFRPFLEMKEYAYSPSSKNRPNFITIFTALELGSKWKDVKASLFLERHSLSSRHAYSLYNTRFSACFSLYLPLFIF